MQRKLRLAFGALVGLVCVGGVLCAVLLLGPGSAPGEPASAPGEPASDSARVNPAPHKEPIQPERVRLAKGFGGSIGGHGGSVPGMSEGQLRRFETATLGPQHAREHALARRATRQGPAGGQSKLTPASVPGPPENVGRWDPAGPFSIPVMGVHAAVLPTGKVMWFSYPRVGTRNERNRGQAWLWNPANGQTKQVDPPLLRDPEDGQLKPANIWCSGQTFTADGRLVVFGGNLKLQDATSGYKGLKKAYTFNPFNETWTEQPDMRHGRWYPSGVRLPDGRIPILSGWDESGTHELNTDVEMFTPSADMDGVGSMSLIGGAGGPGQPPTGEFYPHMFAMPSGRALVAGPHNDDSWFMDPPGASSFTWSDAPNPRRRLWGTAVPVPDAPSKVMALGGTTVSTTPSDPSADVFDEDNPGQGWQGAAPMNVGRGHANTVLLPDGSMVEVGGGVGSRGTQDPLYQADPEHRQIELWNPTTRAWTLGPSQAEYRAYHSTAMLLPDGRVISAGDDFNGGLEGDTGEIYEPPYLFKGPRPTISSAPTDVTLGSTFGVQTPATNVTRAALVAPSAVTHSVDMNQRHIPLQVTQRSGCVDLRAPPNPNGAPPGYYMLFLVNDQGVPSIAKFVKLQSGGTATTCDPRPPQRRRRPSPTLR